MKKIEAIFKSEKLDEVKDALKEAGFSGMTVFPVKGRGNGGGIQLQWRAGSYQVDFLHKVLLMIVVPDDQRQTVVDIIQGICQTPDHAPGAGKIFVSHVEEVIHMRTGQREQ